MFMLQVSMFMLLMAMLLSMPSQPTPLPANSAKQTAGASCLVEDAPAGVMRAALTGAAVVWGTSPDGLERHGHDEGADEGIGHDAGDIAHKGYP